MHFSHLNHHDSSNSFKLITGTDGSLTYYISAQVPDINSWVDLNVQLADKAYENDWV